MDSLVKVFTRVGLDPAKAAETAKSKRLSSAFGQVIQEAGCEGGCDRSVGLLLYGLAAACTPDALKHRGYISRRILKGEIRSDDQVQAAIRFCGMNSRSDTLDDREFNTACGVGAVVDDLAVKKAVAEAISKHSEGLGNERYNYSFSSVLKTVREHPEMRWADRKLVKTLTDAAIEEFLGPRGIQDENKTSGKKEKKAAATERQFEGEVLRFHKPGGNKQLNEELARKHLEATGGRVVTRFPPEPNGFLHIGHAKAVNFNFKYAQANGGITYLRFDDTNPEAEEPRYYDAIRENVSWLGFAPYKETAASDYFPQLYECAVKLIRRGRAYVCHMTPEEINKSRGGDSKGPRYDSPWRNRSVEENLAEFEKMRTGQYREGAAVLRLKQDMQSPNPCMWDLVAYRVLYTPHCRTGRQWSIYPMYDFTHCLCDSIENITHSLCTTEFILAREAYYWVCDQLEVYKAVQWEYGRMRITNTVLSKRKLAKLVELGHVRSWDDPRLYTISALRRRGFTPAAINNFVEDIGITTASSIIDVRKLEACVRDDLNKTTMRRMAVLEPLLLKITNLPGSFEEMIAIPNDPRDPSKGASKVPLTNQLYIDACDFRIDSSDPNYFRLTPAQPVGLFKAGVFTAAGFEADERGKVIAVNGTLDRSENAAKPKTFIQWVPLSPAHGSPVHAELRIYSSLFRSQDPESVPGGFLADINPDSLRVVSDAFVDPRMRDAKVEEKFQMQRLGYYCVDPDTLAASKLVLNLTVGIKEDSSKD